MANRNDLGIYQMDNGRWGYRITQEVNGKLKDVRRVRDENGNPSPFEFHRNEKGALL